MEQLTHFLLPGESVTELENLHAAWQLDFPGTTQTLLALREQLFTAHLLRKRADNSLHEFQQTLLAQTALPLNLWDTRELRRFQLLQKLCTQANLNFNRALTAIQSFEKPKSQAQSPVPAALLKSTDIPVRPVGRQSIDITVENGEVKTTYDLDAAFWCEKSFWQNTSFVCRDFYFSKAVVPDVYAWVLTDNGQTYPPAWKITIAYSPEEFARLCKLELETACEFPLDGQRLGYLHGGDFIPVEN